MPFANFKFPPSGQVGVYNTWYKMVETWIPLRFDNLSEQYVPTRLYLSIIHPETCWTGCISMLSKYSSCYRNAISQAALHRIGRVEGVMLKLKNSKSSGNITSNNFLVLSIVQAFQKFRNATLIYLWFLPNWVIGQLLLRNYIFRKERLLLPIIFQYLIQFKYFRDFLLL